jgi:hypothetical protein
MLCQDTDSASFSYFCMLLLMMMMFVITDVEVGPDGYLYILTFGKEGTLYKIVPTTANSSKEIVKEKEKKK